MRADMRHQTRAPGAAMIPQGPDMSPEGVAAGFLRIVGHDHTRLGSEIADALDNASWRQRLAKTPNPYGDGNAANRIVADMLRLVCD